MQSHLREACRFASRESLNTLALPRNTDSSLGPKLPGASHNNFAECSNAICMASRFARLFPAVYASGFRLRCI